MNAARYDANPTTVGRQHATFSAEFSYAWSAVFAIGDISKIFGFFDPLSAFGFDL